MRPGCMKLLGKNMLIGLTDVLTELPSLPLRYPGTHGRDFYDDIDDTDRCRRKL